jgi:NTE family protein
LPDLQGAALLAVALGCLTLGLVKGPDWGWVGAATIGSFFAGVVAMLGFVLRSRTNPTPLIEPALLSIRSFAVGSALTLVASSGFYAYLLTHVLFLNYVWHCNLLRAAWRSRPPRSSRLLSPPSLGRLADRHGYRVIITVGALLALDARGAE